jgi:N-acetyl sugar amidotransferase
VRYCTLCVLPDTRPNLCLDSEGVCDACRMHGHRDEVDWSARGRQFKKLVSEVQARSSRYDCLIPVSGGKDSTWQVVTCLEHGLTPLAVTWKPWSRTEIGQKNLENLIALGVDHIDYQINPSVEALFLRRSFERFGSTGVPMHLAIFNIPLTIAARHSIPLVIYGENSATEYGGGEGEFGGYKLDAAWLERFGVTHGTTARDWIGEGLTERNLSAYFGPAAGELEDAGVAAIFLGHFFPWDPETSLEVASAHGFRARAEGPKTGWYDYADIDDDFISIHHWLKWPKFGFTRTFDNLSLEIRNGRMTREQAISALRERGDETPTEDIAAFCSFTGMSSEEFFGAVERFRNPKVWTRRDGVWMIDDFIVADWKWQ